MVVFPEALTTVSMGMNVDETGFSLTHGNAPKRTLNDLDTFSMVQLI